MRGFWNWLIFSVVAITLILFVLFNQQLPEDQLTPPDWVKVDDFGWCNVMYLDSMYYAVSKDGKSVASLTKEDYLKLKKEYEEGLCE